MYTIPYVKGEREREREREKERERERELFNLEQKGPFNPRWKDGLLL